MLDRAPFIRESIPDALAPIGRGRHRRANHPRRPDWWIIPRSPRRCAPMLLAAAGAALCLNSIALVLGPAVTW